VIDAGTATGAGALMVNGFGGAGRSCRMSAETYQRRRIARLSGTAIPASAAIQRGFADGVWPVSIQASYHDIAGVALEVC